MGSAATTKTVAGIEPHEPPATPRALLVTRDEHVLDAVLRVAATVGVELEVAHEGPLARRSWSTAPAVLIGADLVGAVAELALPRRDGVVVVGVSPGSVGVPVAESDDVDDLSLWQRALAVGAEHVALLPSADGWLAERLGDLDVGRSRGRVLGVMGAVGGCGASTLAAALAVRCAQRGGSSLIVDADVTAAGIDLLLGAEEVSGSRWPQLAHARGRVAAATLAEVLPQVAGVHVLSWERRQRSGAARSAAPAGGSSASPTVAANAAVQPSALDAVLAGAVHGYDLVVVDLARQCDDLTVTALNHVDLIFLVVPLRVRAVAAAQEVLRRLQQWPSECCIVAREPSPGGVDTADVRSVLELPVVAALADDPSRAAAEDRGEPPGLAARSGSGKVAAALLDLASPTLRSAS